MDNEHKACKGDWVQIYNEILSVGQRAVQIPEETRKVPLEMFVKGFLNDDVAVVGDMVRIKTVVGRELTGKMVAVKPSYLHDFGDYVEELAYIGRQARQILNEGV